MNSAVRGGAGDAYPSNDIGWGAIDVAGALGLSGRRSLRVWDVRHMDGLTTGATHTMVISCTGDAEQLRITLVWTEPPGTIGAGDPVVNNLALVVTSPAGDELVGNVFENGASVIGGRPDTRNNVQTILVDQPQAGSWTIEVVASAVNVGAPGQGFAVAAAGDLADPQ